MQLDRLPRPAPRSLRAVRLGIVVALLGNAACGGDGADEPARAYTLRIEAVDDGDAYDFRAIDPIDLRVGDRVTFEMKNAGRLIHDLQVVHPDGQPIGTAASAPPGGSVSVTVDFEEPGFYRLNCNVDDHLTLHDMQAIVEVLDRS